MHIRFVLLASGAVFDIPAHKLYEAWPPELSGNELMSLEITRVTDSLVVMTAGEDGTMERSFQGDIDATIVCQDIVVIFPVREVRLEGSRDVLQG